MTISERPIAAAEEEESAGAKARQRGALRRLQDEPPSNFERLIDALYAWKEQNDYASNPIALTDIMRRLIQQNHNITDEGAVRALEGYIKEFRMKRISAAIDKLGVDEAERILRVMMQDEQDE